MQCQGAGGSDVCWIPSCWLVDSQLLSVSWFSRQAESSDLFLFFSGHQSYLYDHIKGYIFQWKPRFWHEFRSTHLLSMLICFAVISRWLVRGRCYLKSLCSDSPSKAPACPYTSLPRASSLGLQTFSDGESHIWLFCPIFEYKDSCCWVWVCIPELCLSGHGSSLRGSCAFLALCVISHTFLQFSLLFSQCLTLLSFLTPGFISFDGVLAFISWLPLRLVFLCHCILLQHLCLLPSLWCPCSLRNSATPSWLTASKGQYHISHADGKDFLFS